MNIITVAKTLITILPIITEVITNIEVIDQSAGNGKAKKELALAVIKTIYDATSPAVSFDTLRNQIEATVDAVVAFYNSVGKFIKGVKQAA